MKVISTSEFKENTGVYFGIAKDGEEIVLETSDNGRFELVPVTDYDIISDECILEPDEDLARAITGEELLARLIPRIEKLFDK